MKTTPSLPSDVPDGISKKKVLFVDFDGVRLDKLRAHHTPNLDALAARGQFGVSYIADSALGGTWSGHGHANLLTGVWVDKHRSPDNDFSNPNFEQYPDFLTRLEQVDPGFSTFSTADWAPLNDFVIGRPDVKLQQVGPSIKATDVQSVDAAVEVLATRNPDAMLVYLHDADAMGHEFTADSPQYQQAIETLDRQFGQLIAAVRARPTYPSEDWLIVASTDHGVTDYGHGGDEHTSRKIWILAAGGDIPVTDEAMREWRQVDIVPTIFRHLGVRVDPAWDLDGVPIGTESSDPFDTLVASLQGVVDAGDKPGDAGGWTKQTPHGWTIDERTPAVGVTEYRGWSFMSGEFWTSSREGEGRGSFVRGRDVIAVADPALWNGVGDPVAAGHRFDSTLYSPWQPVEGGGVVEVTFLHHYNQRQTGVPQRAEVIAEFSDGSTQALWSCDDGQGVLFEISQPVTLRATAPAAAGDVRIGWRLSDAAGNGYWAVDAPAIHTGAP